MEILKRLKINKDDIIGITMYGKKITVICRDNTESIDYDSIEAAQKDYDELKAIMDLCIN